MPEWILPLGILVLLLVLNGRQFWLWRRLRRPYEDEERSGTHYEGVPWEKVDRGG